MTAPATSLGVVRRPGSHRLEGPWAGADTANAFLAHEECRCFAPSTVRAYAFDLLNFGRFLIGQKVALIDVVPTDLFDYLDWHSEQRPGRRGNVVRLAERRGPAPAT